MKITRAILILFFSFFLAGCKKGKELKTSSGFKYVLYTESKGAKAKIGNYITMEMAYRNSNDSILFDSKRNGAPIRFRLEKIPFRGSFEEGLTYLAIGDSATFYVPADSLYNFLYKSHGAKMILQNETNFTPGSFLKFDIKLLNIQGDMEAEQEMLIELSNNRKKEKTDLAEFIKRKHLLVAPDSAGYYLIVREKGNGASIDSGKVVEIEYEGRFLNDSLFDGTKGADHPYRFISGAGHVILGWELALKKLHAGDKIT